MRLLILLASTTMLAACGGAGPQSAGSSATPTGGTGGGTDNGTAHTFVDPTEAKTYTAVGSSHSYQSSVEDPGSAGQQRTVRQTRQNSQLYQGDATTVRNSNLTIAYDPRDAIFNVSFTNGLAGTSGASRFQDPLHRTDFGGAIEPQVGTPDLGSTMWNIQGVQYLESGSSNNVTQARPVVGEPAEFLFDLIDQTQAGSYDATTFFYQLPGTDTQYVTFAGYLRNTASVSYDGDTGLTTQTSTLERGAFAYGEVTANDDVPTSGTGTFDGTMLATMVFNDQPDITGNSDTYMQWIAGNASTSVDFGANTFSLSLDGLVGAPTFDGTSGQHSVLEGAGFFANGGGDINLVSAGGFFGQFNEAWFINPDSSRLDLVIAGSSINGAFYGPDAAELGGGYRIVGGTPDERIDILGTFVGKQP
ncbi:transferrin-binding protein-like solute binding protein [uncultured Parasphingorhabdus sp.]|uniref:transferrin-binding protein-like solute binding protein n=1 Tax=uncultured Parasphingorhabdus sp. TaxID=2709694 RepID=UPI002AA77948|nr:transferrin-binding protein-like solute binding protein [uncultured Parasphingorhabdus sp.]